ncbi:hypothetical protein BdWA1_001401 [Babesia duncani]|uniref:Uncharacterized protein n=1 Tax=Babesia duncani TaxID=323732 RepID=A0AAD9PP11_9APIC|nr:hypothetical protein BdWA1_001401 [Babesia duncani]
MATPSAMASRAAPSGEWERERQVLLELKGRYEQVIVLLQKELARYKQGQALPRDSIKPLAESLPSDTKAFKAEHLRKMAQLRRAHKIEKRALLQSLEAKIFESFRLKLKLARVLYGRCACRKFQRAGSSGCWCRLNRLLLVNKMAIGCKRIEKETLERLCAAAGQAKRQKTN